MAAAVAAQARAAADLIVMAAAVADFRPSQPPTGRSRRSQGVPTLELEPTPDILAGLRDLAPGAVLVGFAAETDDLETNARAKLDRKRADFLVANDVSRTDIAFGNDANEVTVFRRTGEPVALARAPKPEIAKALAGPLRRRPRFQGLERRTGVDANDHWSHAKRPSERRRARRRREVGGKTPISASNDRRL